MLTSIQSYAARMGSDPIFVDQLVDEVGQVIEDYGPNVLLKPRDLSFTTIDIVKRPGTTTLSSNIPSHIILTPAQPPAIEALVDTFGEYRRLANRKPLPPRVIFNLDFPDKPYTVSLIAEIRQGYATKITLLRERRAESSR